MTPRLKSFFAERGTPEWDRAWGLLSAENGGDLAEGCACGCGERWQYMGSYSDGQTTCHEFRHRHHPITGQRAYRRYTEEGTTAPPRPFALRRRQARGAVRELRPLLDTFTPETRAVLCALLPELGER